MQARHIAGASLLISYWLWRLSVMIDKTVAGSSYRDAVSPDHKAHKEDVWQDHVVVLSSYLPAYINWFTDLHGLHQCMMLACSPHCECSHSNPGRSSCRSWQHRQQAGSRCPCCCPTSRTGCHASRPHWGRGCHCTRASHAWACWRLQTIAAHAGVGLCLWFLRTAMQQLLGKAAVWALDTC